MWTNHNKNYTHTQITFFNSIHTIVLQVIGTNNTTGNLVKIYRLWIPESSFLHHVIFEHNILPQHKVQSKFKAQKYVSITHNQINFMLYL